MDGVDVDNKQLLKQTLTINLPDGNMVQSTHWCNNVIPGLPTILMGHIVPHLAIASLIGIQPLCKAGCKVIFDDMKCNEIYDGKVILRGNKDPSTDLWTLPIPTGRMGTTRGDSLLPQPGTCESCAPHPPVHSALACFTHSVRTRANAVKFAHQSLCNPTISTLLKTTQSGFLKGCPNISKDNKYLNHSPATAKGHMKHPHHGIKSTHPKPPRVMPTLLQPEPPLVAPILPIFNKPRAYLGPAYGAIQGPALIGMDDNESIASVFCFGAFTNKTNGLVYHVLMGSFLFVSLNSSVCFFVLYHYKSNCILASPIAGLDNKTIFKVYKKHFDELTAKGFKPKLNIMDNQATKYIKKNCQKTSVNCSSLSCTTTG